jgi:acetyltransferase-like isoleucine patch superfamily enzyme
MKKEELGTMRNKVKNFLKSDKKVLEISYKNTYLNPTKYYHRILFRNPLTFLWKYVLSGICYLLPASRFKNSLYRTLGMKIGKEVSISAGALFDLGYPQLITIGDGTIIGTGVKILTHETNMRKIRIGRITIGKKVLIGVRSVLRSGIAIGDTAVVGMGAVVINDVKPKNFVGGVPAKKL